MAIKRIPIASLKPGMYLVGLDRSWIATPFFSHKFLVDKQAQIDKLKQISVRFVDIDTGKGLDVEGPARLVETPPEPPPTEAPVVAQMSEPDPILAVQAQPELHGTDLKEEFSEARKVRKEMMASVRDLLGSVRTSGTVDTVQTKKVAEQVITTTLAHDQAIVALIRTRQFNPELYDHALSVSTLAVLLARLLGYGQERLQTIAMAGLVHDVGLLRLPQNLLLVRRAFTPSEQKLYDSHPMLGMEVLKQSGGFSADVLEIVARHHAPPPRSADEREGSLAEFTRLIQVADAYDQLLTGQGDRPPLPVRDALRLLYKEGQASRVDAELTAHLISQIGIYPLYSFVELNTGHRGIVASIQPGELLKPMVLLTHGPDRRPYEEPMPVNLAAGPSENAPLEITTVLDPEEAGVNVEAMLADWVAI
jgi:putative nucleotidyltransferase with HDIG domain